MRNLVPPRSRETPPAFCSCQFLRMWSVCAAPSALRVWASPAAAIAAVFLCALAIVLLQLPAGADDQPRLSKSSFWSAPLSASRDTVAQNVHTTKRLYARNEHGDVVIAYSVPGRKPFVPSMTPDRAVLYTGGGPVYGWDNELITPLPENEHLELQIILLRQGSGKDTHSYMLRLLETKYATHVHCPAVESLFDTEVSYSELRLPFDTANWNHPHAKRFPPVPKPDDALNAPNDVNMDAITDLGKTYDPDQLQNHATLGFVARPGGRKAKKPPTKEETPAPPKAMHYATELHSASPMTATTPNSNANTVNAPISCSSAQTGPQVIYTSRNFFDASTPLGHQGMGVETLGPLTASIMPMKEQHIGNSTLEKPEQTVKSCPEPRNSPNAQTAKASEQAENNCTFGAKGPASQLLTGQALAKDQQTGSQKSQAALGIHNDAFSPHESSFLATEVPPLPNNRLALLLNQVLSSGTNASTQSPSVMQPGASATGPETGAGSGTTLRQPPVILGQPRAASSLAGVQPAPQVNGVAINAHNGATGVTTKLFNPLPLSPGTTQFIARPGASRGCAIESPAQPVQTPQTMSGYSQTLPNIQQLHVGSAPAGQSSIAAMGKPSNGNMPNAANTQRTAEIKAEGKNVVPSKLQAITKTVNPHPTQPSGVLPGPFDSKSSAAATSNAHGDPAIPPSHTPASAAPNHAQANTNQAPGTPMPARRIPGANAKEVQQPFGRPLLSKALGNAVINDLKQLLTPAGQSGKKPEPEITASKPQNIPASKVVSHLQSTVPNEPTSTGKVVNGKQAAVISAASILKKMSLRYNKISPIDFANMGIVHSQVINLLQKFAYDKSANSSCYTPVNTDLRDIAKLKYESTTRVEKMFRKLLEEAQDRAKKIVQNPTNPCWTAKLSNTDLQNISYSPINQAPAKSIGAAHVGSLVQQSGPGAKSNGSHRVAKDTVASSPHHSNSGNGTSVVNKAGKVAIPTPQGFYDNPQFALFHSDIMVGMIDGSKTENNPTVLLLNLLDIKVSELKRIESLPRATELFRKHRISYMLGHVVVDSLGRTQVELSEPDYPFTALSTFFYCSYMLVFNSLEREKGIFHLFRFDILREKVDKKRPLYHAYMRNILLTQLWPFKGLHVSGQQAYPQTYKQFSCTMKVFGAIETLTKFHLSELDIARNCDLPVQRIPKIVHKDVESRLVQRGILRGATNHELACGVSFETEYAVYTPIKCLGQGGQGKIYIADAFLKRSLVEKMAQQYSPQVQTQPCSKSVESQRNLLHCTKLCLKQYPACVEEARTDGSRRLNLVMGNVCTCAECLEASAHEYDLISAYMNARVDNSVPEGQDDEIDNFVTRYSPTREWIRIPVPIKSDAKEGADAKITYMNALIGFARRGFSQCRLGGLLAMPRTVAIKMIRDKGSLKSKKADVFWKVGMSQEHQIHERMDHPNILRLYESIFDCKTTFIVMEYCQDTLSAYVKSHWVPSTNGYTPDEFRPPLLIHVVKAMSDILLGLSYLDENNVAHFDIKPSNILWSQVDRRWKIADFGLAMTLSLEVSVQCNALKKACRPSVAFPLGTTYGTMDFYAPEMLASGHKDGDYASYMMPYQLTNSKYLRFAILYTSAVDIYSLATVLYYMVTSTTPFDKTTSQLVHAYKDRNSNDEYDKLLAEYGLRLRDPFGFLPKDSPFMGSLDGRYTPLTDLLKALWTRDPLQRPTAHGILRSALYAAVVDGAAEELRMLNKEAVRVQDYLDPLWGHPNV